MANALFLQLSAFLTSLFKDHCCSVMVSSFREQRTRAFKQIEHLSFRLFLFAVVKCDGNCYLGVQMK
jgi:hypothetical protein